MGIVAEDIARVRAATDLIALISEHTQIKRSGRQWMARCPLHGERTPSLSVSPEKGVYYCFGCQRSGDAITFVQEIEGLDFVAAVERLAGRAGIALRYDRHDDNTARIRNRRLLEAVTEARDFYHQLLLKDPDAGGARDYLRARGYDGDLVRGWHIGWAPDNWDVLCRHLRLSNEELRDSGLGFLNRRSRQQDFFRARVVFPINDDRGNPVGFGGRLLPGADGPKYINTSNDCKVYDKRRVLYGLHQHRKEIVKAGQAIVCEGYTDVIGCAAAGAMLAVATCGTALTQEHVRLLKRFSASRLVLAFDADAAGLDAVGRVYEWEREFELEVLVADLPPQQDPGELGHSDPQRLRLAIDRAVPFLQFRVDRVLETADMSSIESRARAAEKAVTAVVRHPDAMVRDPHVVRIADRCRVDVEHLRSHLAQQARRSPDVTGGDAGHGRMRQRERGDRGRGDRGRGDRGRGDRDDGAEQVDDRVEQVPRLTAEDEALKLAIHQPEAVGDNLHATLFGDPLRREAFEALTAAGGMVSVSDQGSPAATRLLHRLAVDPDDTSVEDVLAGLARQAANRAMNDLRRMAAASADPEYRKYCVASIAWLKSQSEWLGERSARGVVLEQLLPWLIEHGCRHG